MFYQIFLSPQVKQSMIISNKHGINKLHHKLVNDLRVRILENYEIGGEGGGGGYLLQGTLNFLVHKL